MTDPLLCIQSLSVRFGGLMAVSDVSFDVTPGQVCALIGPNGAGKTTLFNAVSGHATPTEGRILLRGAPIQGLLPHVISAQGVRRTFQNGGLFVDLTVLENVLVGLHGCTESSLFGAVVGMPFSIGAERAATARARELLRMMQIAHLADYRAGGLSGGQQRMVEIVRALATSPPLLLLDEPAVGLSPPMRAQLGTVIRQLADDGLTVLLIEHAIELVMSISDRIVVMSAGRKVADGTPDAVRADRAVLEAYLGHA